MYYLIWQLILIKCFLLIEEVISIIWRIIFMSGVNNAKSIPMPNPHRIREKEYKAKQGKAFYKKAPPNVTIGAWVNSR